MTRSKDFIDGWAMGWTAATQALLRSLDQLKLDGVTADTGQQTVRLEAAANKPVGARRRRGRPPKTRPPSAEQPRRKRGRPPKSP